MTDQDWEVDGATGGSATASSGTDSGVAGGAGSLDERRTAPDPSGPQTAKVVPFPGNWFGSIDELIPIHPEPRAPVIELAPEAPDPLDVDVAAADASDFWEGDADALEEVSVPAAPRSAITLLRSSGAPKRNTASDRTPATEPGSASGDEPTAATHRTRRIVAAVIALVAGSACVLLATGVLSGPVNLARAEHRGHHASATGRHTAPAVTQTITSAAVTVTTKVRARPRHHHKSARTGTARPTAGSTAAADTESQTSAASTPPPSTSKPALSPSHSAATSTSSSSGSGCAAQSPDSGCRP